MSFISPITNRISSGLKTCYDYCLKKPDLMLSRTQILDKACKKFQDPKTNAAWIAGLGVFSVILKDGFGCYLYVTQSLNNKEIPEDKRKFVAALDLANGGQMILLQILMTYTISKKAFQEKMFNKMFGKMFNRQTSKSIQAVMEQKDHLKGKVKGNQDFHRAFESYKDASIAAFGSLTALIAATTIGKRIITPFIATPLADKTKEWMCRNDKPPKIHKDTKNTYDTSISAGEKAEKQKKKQPQISNLLNQAIKNAANKTPNSKASRSGQISPATTGTVDRNQNGNQGQQKSGNLLEQAIINANNKTKE